MTDRPIIFSAPMVRALLDGRKTQTRRLAWLNKGDPDPQVTPHPTVWQLVQPGDRLWVREAGNWCRVDGVRYAASGMPNWNFHQPWKSPIHMPRWASRLTLHVEATRVERLQEISEEDARAEGLALLSKDQGRVRKWGIADRDGLPGNDSGGWPWTMWCVGHQPAFSRLWNLLHGPGAWEANPEVVAITFRVERRNIGAIEERAP
jgi:hypothetical protein